jgi:hypothetical protein
MDTASRIILVPLLFVLPFAYAVILLVNWEKWQQGKPVPLDSWLFRISRPKSFREAAIILLKFVIVCFASITFAILSILVWGIIIMFLVAGSLK